jgi:hypothetical protein
MSAKRVRGGASIISVVTLLALAGASCSSSPDDDAKSPRLAGPDAEAALSQLITRADLVASNTGIGAEMALNVIDPGWAVTESELRAVEDEMCRVNSTSPLEEFVWARLPGARPQVWPVLGDVVLEAMKRCDASDAVRQQMAFLQTITYQRAHVALEADELGARNREICAMIAAGDTLVADHVIRALARRLSVTIPAVVVTAVMSTCPSWVGPVESVLSGIVSAVT